MNLPRLSKLPFAFFQLVNRGMYLFTCLIIILRVNRRKEGPVPEVDTALKKSNCCLCNISN